MMLARFAENAFWLGRYIERTESLVRLLAVTDTFAADQDGEAAWLPVLKVYDDIDAFAARGKPISGLNVAQFYFSDRAHPNSIANSIAMAKSNARTLRHLISTEAWRQISVFDSRVSAIAKRRLANSKLSDLCEEIRNACFNHNGVIESTCYRDEVWLFNRLGAALERADQVTRFIDMKYFQVDAGDDSLVTVPDVAWWNTLLRSASGYHAFQRRYSFNPDPAQAAEFLLFDIQFPRSVRGAANTVFGHLKTLERDFDAKPGPIVSEAASAFANRLMTPPEKLSGRALHRYLDQIQRDIIALANGLKDRYFSPAN